MEQLLSLRSALNLPKMGAGKSIWLAMIAALVLGAVAYVAIRPNAQMGLLYAGLDPAEAGKVGAKLDELKVPFEVSGDGGTLLVPMTQVARVRMELAASGLPHQGGAGYELLDQQSPMNMTSFMQRVQRLRALEGELARTISTMNGVKSARVHLVLPEREGFSRDVPKPTASVTVIMEGPGRLSPSQASAVRLLVAGAVPRMQQEDVSVLDPQGVVLAADGGGSASASNRLTELQASQEQSLQSRVTALLEPLVGSGKVRVAAAMQLSTDRETERDEKFDPLSQVERSKQTENSHDSSDENQNKSAVSVGQNVPNQQPNAGAAGGARNSTSSNHTTETVNYELSSTTSEKVREPGELERQTVAVVVDGMTDAKGQYTPRSQEELDRLKALVQSAVGFDEKRGDIVTVETMHFVPQDEQGGTGSDAGQAVAPALPMKIIIPAGVGGVLLIGLLLVLLMRGKPQAPALLPATGDGGDLRLGGGMGGADGMMNEPEDLFSISAVGGRPRSPVLQQLNNMVDDRPEESLAVLRNWILESGAV